MPAWDEETQAAWRVLKGDEPIPGSDEPIEGKCGAELRNVALRTLEDLLGRPRQLPQYKRYCIEPPDGHAMHIGCDVDGCPNAHYGRGWCKKHYHQWRNHGDPCWSPPEKVTVCSVEGCSDRIHGLGYCNMHYRRLKRTGTLEAQQRRSVDFVPRKCKVDGCETEAKTMGFCIKHYVRNSRNGTPDTLRLHLPTIQARFWKKVDKNGPYPAWYTLAAGMGRCWVWTGQISRHGRGLFKMDYKTRGAYVISYEWEYGPVPKGLEIDHLCMEPLCVNPMHLEAVTHQENQRRLSEAIRKLPCKRNHPLTRRYTTKIGTLACRDCEIIYQKEYQKNKVHDSFAWMDFAAVFDAWRKQEASLAPSYG